MAVFVTVMSLTKETNFTSVKSLGCQKKFYVVFLIFDIFQNFAFFSPF